MSSSIIKNAVIVVGVEQGQVNFKLPNLDKALKDNDRLNKTLDRQVQTLSQVERAQQQTLKQAEVTARGQVNLASQAAQSQEQFAASVRQAQRGILEASQQAGEGVFALARGFTLLGVTGDKNLRKVLESLALVQAGFDIFRGAGNIIKGVIAATEALAIAKKASAVATTAETAAVVANTRAKVANVAATGAMVAASAPLLITLGVLAAALAAAAFVRRKFAVDTEAAAKAQERYVASLDKETEAISRLASRGQRRRGVRALGFDTAEQQLQDLQGDRRRQRDELFESQTLFQLSGADRGILGIDRRLDVAAAATRQEVTARQALIATDEQILRLQKQKRQEQIDSNRLRAQEIRQQQQSVEAAQRAADVERQRANSTRAAAGRLDELGQARLRQISAKRARGERLNNSELDFVGGLGAQGSDFANQRFAERGAQFDQQLGALFGKAVDAEVRKAQGVADQRQAQLDRLAGGEDADAAIARLSENSDKLRNEFDELLSSMIATIDREEKNVEALEKRLDQIETRIQASAE